MKFSLKTVLTGSLLAGAFAILPLVAPFAANAQASTDGMPPALEQLNLTSEQEAQLAEIRQNTRSQMENVLTAEQQEQFKTAREQGRDFREAAASLNLSDEQKTQLRSIMQASREQVATVLTPEQQQQVRQFRQTHRSQRPAQ